MNFVQIDSISDVKQDKNGRNYVQISLSSGAKRTVLDKDSGKTYQVESPGKSTTVNSWEKTYLDESKHWMYDLKVGSLLDGTIYTAQVEPYIIEDEESGDNREVSTYTGFVLGFETDAAFESRVRRMILDNGRLPIESNATASNIQVAKEHQSSEVVDELAKVSVEEQSDVESEY
tara:strand:- start:215 stop:739 length:525 start_codon:yes stop_codon:yes gene_type:complete